MELEVNNIFVLDGRFYIVRCKSDEHLVVERMDNIGPNQYKATGEVEEILLDEMEVA